MRIREEVLEPHLMIYKNTATLNRRASLSKAVAASPPPCTLEFYSIFLRQNVHSEFKAIFSNTKIALFTSLVQQTVFHRLDGPKFQKYGKNQRTVPSRPYCTANRLLYFHNPVYYGTSWSE